VTEVVRHLLLLVISLKNVIYVETECICIVVMLLDSYSGGVQFKSLLEHNCEVSFSLPYLFQARVGVVP
jgi:hypothetical protein